MKFDKLKIKKILAEIIDSNNITNINHFDKEIIIDINTTNPTLKHKKELERKIVEKLNENYSKDFSFKLNIIVVKPTISQKEELVSLRLQQTLLVRSKKWDSKLEF